MRSPVRPTGGRHETPAARLAPRRFGGGPAGEMTMKMKVEAKRIGDCDGDEQVPVGN
jgi:hypothetical protein